MPRLVWSKPEDRQFESGLDRGVLYPRTPPVVGEIAAINEFENPSVETGVGSWQNYSSGIVPSNVVYSRTQPGLMDYGVWALGAASTELGLNKVSNMGRVKYDQPALPLQTYSISGAFASYAPLPPGKKCRIQIVERRPADSPLPSIIRTHLVDFDTLGRKNYTFTTQAETARMDVFFLVHGGIDGVNHSVEMFFDGFMMVKGSEIPYFDGSKAADSDYEYGWLGVPNLSQSYKRTRKNTAVVWNGLISVDESGGESPATYHIDGRPYLHLPKPKEYKSALRAYTYPDEFAALCGLVEIADGMYLDSQMPDVFDLSYRTLVGGSDGGVKGYKIHLVYNATVVPSTATYQTLSDSINNVEFSWEIQAVPVTVEGYRPTAHVVIDTRHMDKSKIEAIEALLYGTGSDLPIMPSPQTIFDILTYGDAIIITDNGDGTWTAEGSYLNIYMIGDEIFQIDNVDATYHGDGTYTVSSTNV